MSLSISRDGKGMGGRGSSGISGEEPATLLLVKLLYSQYTSETMTLGMI